MSAGDVEAWQATTNISTTLSFFNDPQPKRFALLMNSASCEYCFAIMETHSQPPEIQVADDYRPYSNLAAEAARLADPVASWGMPPSLVALVRQVTSLAPVSIYEALESYVRGRVILVGDADHGMRPDLGQNVNCALEDAGTLAELMAACGFHGNDPTKAFLTNCALDGAMCWCGSAHAERKVACVECVGGELSHGTLKQILVLLLKFIEAVRVLKSCEHPMRPDVDSGLLDEREGPLSRMLSNNDRGVVKEVEVLRSCKVQCISLRLYIACSASKTCPLLSGIGAIYLCDNSNVFKADLGRMFFRPDNVGYTRMGEVESALHAINHDVHVEQVHIDCFESCRGLDTTLLHRPPSRQPLPPRPPTSPLPTSPPPLLMFLCVEDLVLTSNVNEWALENNVPLVHATMGPDGLSGLVVTSIRGKTRCLNCYQSSPASSSSSQSPRRTSLDSTFATPLVKKVLPILPASSPCLPMFESIVAGIAAHNALKYHHMLLVHALMLTIVDTCLGLARSWLE
ncbi:hypothetical protein B5M09_008918 [Aphanomyces astaci]|uniref:FAD-binding domain-containing protein n=1 Tax=Aphanomyces astaci TaxID=112090 RepID=A0A425CZ95_APHAT|nr:hypothetical protein B5M09_008918 [Aphanomyces astaci]